MNGQNMGRVNYQLDCFYESSANERKFDPGTSAWVADLLSAFNNCKSITAVPAHPLIAVLI